MATTVKTQAVSDVLVQRVQDEFREMPGLRLTQPQVCRLWGLDRETCGTPLARLVDARFLTRTRVGAFVQLDRTQRSTGANAADLFTRL